VGTANPAGKPPAATPQPGTPNDKTKGNPVHDQNKVKPQVPADKWVPVVLQKYKSEPNLQGADFATAWPQLKQGLINQGQSLATIHAVGQQVEQQINAAHLAYQQQQQAQQAQQDQQAKINWVKSMHPGISDQVAAQLIANNPGGYGSGKPTKIQQDLTRPGKIEQIKSPQQFAKESIARGLGPDGLLQPGVEQQIVQALVQNYNVSPQTAPQIVASMIKQAQQQALAARSAPARPQIPQAPYMGTAYGPRMGFGGSP
jgi:hypothetical protein